MHKLKLFTLANMRVHVEGIEFRYEKKLWRTQISIKIIEMTFERVMGCEEENGANYMRIFMCSCIKKGKYLCFEACLVANWSVN